jgi:hypothetical protein
MTLRQQFLKEDNSSSEKWTTDFQFDPESGWVLENGKELFHYSFISNSPVNSRMVIASPQDNPRDSLGNLKFHPTMSNVLFGFENYIYSSGASTFVAQWNENEISSSEIDNYISYLQNSNMGCTVENIIKNSTSLQFDLVSNNETGGCFDHLRYQLNCRMEMYIRDEGTRLGCLLRPQGEHFDWSTGSYAIASGDTLTINKTGEKCYLMLVGEFFEFNGILKEDKSIIKLNSPSVTVRNTGPETRRIGVIWQ